MSTTKSRAEQSFFVFIKDAITGKITRVAFPSSVQIGTSGNPAELQMTGRFSVAPTILECTATNASTLNLSIHDCAVAVVCALTPPAGYVRVNLPATPREGEVHIVIDESATAGTYPIRIYAAQDRLINGAPYVSIASSQDAVTLIWLRNAWRVISDTSTGGGGAPAAASYVTINSEGGLSHERRLAATAGELTITDGGAGSTVTLSLATIATITPGAYTNTNLTVDSKGRITAISSGTAVTLVKASTSGTVNAFGATNGQILGSNGVTPGGVWRNDLNIQSGAITAPTNPTWNTGTGSFTVGGTLYLTDNNVWFAATAVTCMISQTAPAAGTDATTLSLIAQAGGAASGGAGKTGGGAYIVGGQGGDGTASYASGPGGNAYVRAGNAGVDGGGGTGVGGNTYVNAGAGSTDGTVFVGSTNTAAIYLGNDTNDSTITQSGTGAVTWRGPVDFNCSAITASGNPTWNTGTNTFTVGGVLYKTSELDQFVSSTASPEISQVTDSSAGATGEDLTIAAQSVSDSAGGATAGDLGLRGGQGLVHSGNKDGNVWFHAAPSSWHGAERTIFVGNVVTAPTSASGAGFWLWSTAGHLTTSSQSLLFASIVLDAYVRQVPLSTVDTVANDMLIVAQSSLGGGTSVGGNLVLKSGEGASDANAGWIKLHVAATGGGAQGGFDIVPSSHRANMWGEIYILGWDDDVTNPEIRQSTLATASATGHTLSISGQNCSGSGSTGGTIYVKSGTGTSADGNIEFYRGSTLVSQFANAYYWWHQANHTWTNLVTSPKFAQDTTADATGQTLTIQAQNAATTGGALRLMSGTGGTTPGNVEFWCGNSKWMGQFYSNQLFLTSYAPNLVWQNTAVSPSIYQDVTADASGQHMYIHSQNAATTGGNLYLSSGTGGTSNGNVVVRTGASTNVEFTPNYVTVYPWAIYFSSGATPIVGQHGDGTADVVADDFLVHAQGVSAATGTHAHAGNLGLRGGQATGLAANTDGNVWFHVSPGALATWQSGEKIIFIANAVTEPSTVASGGAFLWAYGDDLKLNSDLYVGGTIYGSGGIIPTGDIVFPKALNSPDIYQETHDVNATGYILTIKAQSAVTTGGDLQLYGGVGGTTQGTIGFYNGASRGAYISSSRFNLDRSSFRWTGTTTNPTISQEDTSTASGQEMIMHAQTSSFAGSTGGHLTLHAGDGVSYGGDVTINAGGGSASGTVYIKRNSSTWWAFTTSSRTVIYQPYVLFEKAVATPALYQEDDSAGSITGDEFTIHAQNATGATSTGGNLKLQSGTGTTANGNLALYYGSSKRIELNSWSNLLYYGWFGFINTVANPYITQADDSTVGGTGQRFKIQAQNNTGGSGSTGGELQLFSGAGTTAGDISFTTGSSKKATFLGNSTTLQLEACNTVQFIYTNTNPTIKQNDDSTASVTGDILTIQAQNTTGGGSTGGALYLKSGTGVLSTGYVRIYAGSTIVADFAVDKLTLHRQYFLFEPTVASPLIFQYEDSTVGATADDLTIAAQGVTAATGTAHAGNLGLRGGFGVGSATNTDGNVWFHVSPGSSSTWQGMQKGIFIANAVVEPSTVASGGAFLWAYGDDIKMNSDLYVGGTVYSSGGLGPTGDIVFPQDLNAPDIYQADSTTHNGYTLAIRAQHANAGSYNGGNLTLTAGSGWGTGGSVVLTPGDGPTPGSVYLADHNGDTALQANVDAVYIGKQWLSILSAVATPTICQQTRASGNGQQMEIHAQSTDGASATGGTLRLAGGTAAGTTSTGGDLALALASGTSASGYLKIQDSSGNWLASTQGLSAFSFGTTYIEFYNVVSSPTIRQISTASGNGQTLTIQAQSTTDASATSNGGALQLKAGNASSSSGGNGGSVYIDGGTGTNSAKAGGSIFLRSGDGGDHDGWIYFYCGTDNQLAILNYSGLYLKKSTVEFGNTVASPTISQASVTGADGQYLTIAAQSCNTASYLAGDLLLKSGAGQTAAYNGDVIVFCGARAHTSFENDGTAAGTRILTHQPLFEFKYSISNPIIRQEADSNNSVTGYRLTIRAQSATGTTSNGGMLALEGGAGTQYGGDVSIAPGGGTSDQSGAVLVGTNVVTRDYYKLYQTFMGKYGRLHAFGEHAYAQTKYSVDGDRQASDWQFGGSVTGTGNVYLGANGSNSELFPVPEGRVIGIWAMVALTEPTSSKKMGVVIVEAVIYRDGAGALSFLTGSPTYTWIGGSSPSTGGVSLTLSSSNAIRFKGTGCTTTADTRFSGIARLIIVG